MAAPAVTVRFTGGRLAGREVEHVVLALHPRELRTLDPERREWRWLVPLGVCKDSPHAVLVDPAGAVAAAKEAGLDRPGHAPAPPAAPQQGILW